MDQSRSAAQRLPPILSRFADVNTSGKQPRGLKEKEKIFKLHKADWEVFQQKLVREVNIVDLDGKNLQQLKDATSSWIKAIKDAMNIAIPKSNQYIFQLKTTLEI